MYLLVNKITKSRNAIERCAPSGPQKHLTKDSDGLYNHSNLLTMI